MVELRNIIDNKKGFSPLFVSLYLAIIVVLLLSLLFFVVEISGSSMVEAMRIEQERRQESIRLAGPKALNLTEGSIVHCLQVNNTGSITIRIRALYIGSKFICDPSRFEGDSYIRPGESLWIQLYPNVQPPIMLNSTTANAQWTVTTERSTRTSEKGGVLYWGQPGVYTPNKFYFGPLMLVFDMFHWRSESGPWRNGWTIPKGTKDVTWRILLVNVDDRDIIITETSCLTLISNDNSPKDPLTWYIDPELSQNLFEPGVFNFVYYTWNKPYSHSGSSRHGITGMKESTTCINFLTFFGDFVESNGTIPFGQTVPFEAVLVTTESMADSLELSSSPENIKNDGVSTSTITANIKDENGNPVPDVLVDFYTTAGVLSSRYATTDSNGVASVDLRSLTNPTTAYVTALCQGVEGNCRVTFTLASKTATDAIPSQISKDGVSTIVIRLMDENNQTVAQSGITVTVERSSWVGKGKKPILNYDGQTGSLVMVTTDSDGRAEVKLIAQGGTGTVTITTSASGLSEDSTVVIIG